MEIFYGRLPYNWANPFLLEIARLTPEFFRHYDRTYINRKNKCEYCTKEGNTHIHHIIPLSEGGTHKNKNFIELCPECHRRVEMGIYEINDKGQYNYRLLRKQRKLMLKFYRYYYLDNCYNFPKQEFIRKHLGLNGAIKYCIKYKDYIRVKNLIAEQKKMEILL